MYFHSSPLFKGHHFLLAKFKGQKNEYLPSNAFKRTLALISVSSITLKTLTRNCSYISLLLIVTHREYVVHISFSKNKHTWTYESMTNIHNLLRDFSIFSLPDVLSWLLPGHWCSHSRRKCSPQRSFQYGCDQRPYSRFAVSLLSDNELDLYRVGPRQGSLERGLRVSHYLRNMGCIRDS